MQLTPGELLDENGLVSQRSSGGPMYYAYTLRGAGEETWTPRFTYYGFRYVQVEGAAPASAKSEAVPILKDLAGEFIYLNVAQTGQFSSSNETLNKIHRLVMAAVQSNLQGVLTDCPHREKLGWLEQSYLMGPSLLFDFDLRNFIPKILEDIHEAQTQSGLIPDIAPEYVKFEKGFRDSPEWGSAGIMLPWMAWQWYGDRRNLELSYGSMKAYADYLRNQTKDGLLQYGLGDWYDIGPGEPGPSKLTPAGFTSTATYYADLKITAETARVLGYPAEAESFGARAAAEREAFQKAFYHEKDQSYASGSQTSLAMPLVLGLAETGARRSLLDKLIGDVRSRTNHTTAGDIGYRYVIEALTENGASDVVFDMAAEKSAPSYAGQLAAGATSLTEAWDANPESSQNHLMLGHIEEWFFYGLAGIRPALSNTGSFSRIDVDPSPVGKIGRVDASWNSDRGPVTVRWIAAGSTFSLNVTVPPGLTAEVYLPAAEIRSVSAPPDAKFLKSMKRRVVYQCESGHYAFQVRPFVE